MKIYIPKALTGTENIVYLVSEDSPVSKILPDQKLNEYVSKRIIAKKMMTVLDKQSQQTIIQALKSDGNIHTKKEAARKAANSLFKTLEDLDMDKFIIQCSDIEKDELFAFAEGLMLSNYRFRKYFTSPDKESFQIKEIGIKSNDIAQEQLDELSSGIKGVCFARDLVNEPLSYLTAVKLSEEIASMGAKTGISVEVFNKKKIQSLRMGGLLAVNKGSVDPPTFTILEWKPENAKNSKPYILVGKGVVFDTGGLSLKPTADSMDYMKCDMGGAAAVAGTFYAIASAKLPIHVIGLIPATDNRPDGNAYVPGDVIEMYNGSTVEVLNTDAEGRMILADALSYASQYDPKLVIELSTLTGSAHAAIGKYGIVGMGNADRETMDDLIASGNNTYERIAEFPFWDEYEDLLKSDIADMKNIGGKTAGAITAGKFLEKFTNYPYIHLDIAGPSFNKTEFNYRGKGGSGVGVRLLFDYFKRISL